MNTSLPIENDLVKGVDLNTAGEKIVLESSMILSNMYSTALGQTNCNEFNSRSSSFQCDDWKIITKQKGVSRIKGLSTFIFRNCGKDKHFTYFECLTLRCLIADMSNLLYPAMCLYLGRRITELINFLHSLVVCVKLIKSTQHRVLCCIIDHMEQISMITVAQSNHLRHLSYLSDSSISPIYNLFLLDDSVSHIQIQLSSLVSSAPLAPPKFNIQAVIQPLPHIDTIPIEVETVFIRLVLFVDSQIITAMDALIIHRYCIENPSVFQHMIYDLSWSSTVLFSIRQQAKSMPDIPLYECMWMGSCYPSVDIRRVFVLLQQNGCLSPHDCYTLAMCCQKKSFALLCAYIRYIVLKNNYFFVYVAKNCMVEISSDTTNGENRPYLSNEEHERLMKWIVENQLINEREAFILTREYNRVENSIVKQTFAVYDAQRNVNEFVVVLKKMAELYSSVTL